MDRNPLLQWQSLQSYTSMMHKMTAAWEDFFRTQQIDWITTATTDAWLSRVKTSLDVLESRHIYDDLDALVINSKYSGFPIRRHIDMLQYSQARVKDDPAKLRQAKQLFLDTLFTETKINLSALGHVAKCYADNRLASELVIEPFRFVGLYPLRAPSKERDAYVCIWERFTDKPMLYAMVFEADVSWQQSVENMSELCENLQSVTALELPLAKVARRMDISDARIHPKWVSRVVLGPVWIPGITKDDHIIQRLLDNECNDEQGSASSILYEHVLSEREADVSTSRIRDQQGRKHNVTQDYTVRSESVYRERGTTFMKETLFVPHKLIQHLESETRVRLGHQLIALER